MKDRLFIAGPCSVGKSTVSNIVSKYLSIEYLDYDNLGIKDMENNNHQISPFSLMGFNLKKSIYPLIENNSNGFIIDMGGENVFRHGVDNDNRLRQILDLKEDLQVKVIVLFSNQQILYKRFCSSKNRKKEEFLSIWNNWIELIFPYWKICGDRFIDTSYLNPERMAEEVIEG